MLSEMCTYTFPTYASTAVTNSLSSSVGRESFMPPRRSLITTNACSGSKYCDSWFTNWKKEIQMLLLFKKCQLIFITKNINLFTLYDFVHTIWYTSALSDTSVCMIITDYEQTKNVQDNKCCSVICGRMYFRQLCSSQNSHTYKKIIHSQGSNNPISVTIM